MKKRQEQHAVEEKMDMTPLIDCVFLLIMFFILTTEITMKASQIDLPFALEGESKELAEGGDVTQLIEVEYDRERAGSGVRGAGRILVNLRKVDFETLKDVLREEVKYDSDPIPYGRGRAKEKLPGGKEVSQLKVRIRADKRVKAEYLRTIFMACQAEGIYKIELSTVQPSQLEAKES